MNSTLDRLFGGSPLGVLFRLIILSVMVGVLLNFLGFDPSDIWASVERLIDEGFSAVVDIFVWGWRYFLLGAVLVFPIWLLLRLLKLVGGRG
jgi:hypothetical protein